MNPADIRAASHRHRSRRDGEDQGEVRARHRGQRQSPALHADREAGHRLDQRDQRGNDVRHRLAGRHRVRVVRGVDVNRPHVIRHRRVHQRQRLGVRGRRVHAARIGAAHRPRERQRGSGKLGDDDRVAFLRRREISQPVQLSRERRRQISQHGRRRRSRILHAVQRERPDVADDHGAGQRRHCGGHRGGIDRRAAAAARAGGDRGHGGGNPGDGHRHRAARRALE